MQRGLCAAAGMTLAFALCNPASAQQQVEWKQTLNMPKGINLPKDVRGEILGIELGDTYAEAKPKLEKLLTESVPPAKPRPPNNADLQGMSPRAQAMAEARRRELDSLVNETMGEGTEVPLTETKTGLRFQAPSGFIVTATYVSDIIIKRVLPGSTKENIRDTTRFGSVRHRRASR